MKTHSSGKHETFSIPELDKLAKKYIPKCVPWTPEAKEVILKYYGKIDITDLQKYLEKHHPPKRSISAIRDIWWKIKNETEETL
jgi:hypothetical protein